MSMPAVTGMVKIFYREMPALYSEWTQCEHLAIAKLQFSPWHNRDVDNGGVLLTRPAGDSDNGR